MVVDDILKLDEGVERRLDIDSVIEDIEEVASDDFVLEVFGVGEDEIDDSWAFEEATVVLDDILELDEEVEPRLEIDSVLEDTEEVVGVDVFVEISAAEEDGTDDS